MLLELSFIQEHLTTCPKYIIDCGRCQQQVYREEVCSRVQWTLMLSHCACSIPSTGSSNLQLRLFWVCSLYKSGKNVHSMYQHIVIISGLL